MDTETALSNDTIQKLKKLLEGFNSFECQEDMYTLCINNSLIEKDRKLAQ